MALTRLVAPARAADRLGQQLPGPLRRALIRQRQGDVRRHDTHERHLGHVEALGHEACPDEHIRPTRHEVIDDRRCGAPAFGHVAVEAADAQLREACPHLVLHPLGATAQVSDPG